MPWRARFRRWLDRWLPAEPPAVVAPPAAHAKSRADLAAPSRRPRTRDVRPLRLALQGGGAHGAFTWGVLDRLLDEPGFAYPMVSGASAGALNGAMLAAGLESGGRVGAQRALAALWDGVGEVGAMMAPMQASQRMAAGLGFPGAAMVEAMLRLWTPAQLNPFDLNPLRDLLERIVDIEALRRSPTRLHVAATSVETGGARLFTGPELSIDALMASACLPFLYQAVTIDGIAYWDGGYSANPPLQPLLADPDRDAATEILLVQINPDRRSGSPSTAAGILDRVNEITFNASLIAELRALEAMQARRVAGDAGDDDDADVPVLHRIALYDEVGEALASTKGSLDAAFHRTLRDHGRTAADRWLRGSPS